jgi:hypothetical protein
MGTLESNCEEDMIIDKPIVIENLCDKFHNKILLQYLSIYKGWSICNDFTSYGDTAPSVNTNTYSDGGFIARTFSLEQPMPENSYHLNEAAYFILSKVAMHLDIKTYTGHRYNWNYYNRSSTGTQHRDADKSASLVSILYNLNTNDGGTIIDGTMYSSVAGTAIVFPSHILHKGVGPTKSSQRYNLNIIFAER